jgi:hypothetical protein
MKFSYNRKFTKGKNMESKIDEYCDSLKSGLHTVQKRLEGMKENLNTMRLKGEGALRTGLDGMRNQVQIGEEQVTKIQENLIRLTQHRIADSKEAIALWKTNREEVNLNERADESEHHAESAVKDALTMIQYAEEAILEAAIARSDADSSRVAV